MTAQRSLRELQHRGLTYVVVSKGAFVHRLASQRIGTDGQPDPTCAAPLPRPMSLTSTGASPSAS